jgi:endoglucanase
MSKMYRHAALLALFSLGCVDTSPRDDLTAAPTPDGGRSQDAPAPFARPGHDALGDLAIAVPPPGGGMRDLPASDLVKDMIPGWNLGNAMDAVGGERAWGNPPTTQPMIQAVVAAGFRGIRIPVTWRQHFGAAPDYRIDPTWLARVQTIVDWTLAAGAYAIINLHHDGGGDSAQGAWIRGLSTDYAGVMTQYLALWEQIATYFQDYPDRLIFESMNEVGFDDLKVNGQVSPAAYDLLNALNAEFTTLVRGTGGNNGQRHLLLAGYYTDIDQSIRGVVLPADPRAILSLHYYTPYQFAINGSPSTWGSPTEIATLRGQFAKVKTAFIDRGIPVILGEFGADRKTELASRIFWVEWVAKAACDLGAAPFLWDAGDEFNRATLAFRNPGLVQAILRACGGADYTPVKG